MSLIAEIGAAFSPREYPRLSLVSTGRTIGVLFLVTLLVAGTLAFQVLGALGALRGVAGEWVDQLPEMVLVNGRLSADIAGPLLMEGGSSLLAIDTGDMLNLEDIAQEYESFVILRETEIVTGGRVQGAARRPYPRIDSPLTTEDFRALVERGARLLPFFLLIGCLLVWVWLGLAQLSYATAFSAVAYLVTAGARPRHPYSRLWRLAGHAMIPAIALSAVNALLHLSLGGQRLGLGWVGVGTAAVYCALGVNALLHQAPTAPDGPPAGGPSARGADGGTDAGTRPPARPAGPTPPTVI
jgi:hypothetical protein